MRPFQTRFLETLAACALLVTASNCEADADSPATPGGTSSAPTPLLEVPSILTWSMLESGETIGDLKIGDAVLPEAEIRAGLLGLRRSFSAFGPATLLWQLLDGGYGATAVLHHTYAEQSEAARKLAEAAYARIETQEDFFAELQQAGGDVAPSLEPPSPVTFGGIGASFAAELETGEWSRPFRSVDGWEILYIEERIPGLRMRTSLSVRRIVFPVATESARNQARQEWAKLPLSGSERIIRSLPASFRRDRVELSQ